jgi:GMP synthase (glutamine-hydrolysing)
VQEKIIILDFGSQYTQLIARRIRELNVYCEIRPFSRNHGIDDSVKGVILSGSPSSVRDKNAPEPDLSGIKGERPLLGVCYGAQYLVHHYGGEVLPSETREYGRANLKFVKHNSDLFSGVTPNTQVWMSHGDTITRLPRDYEVIGSTEDVKVGAFKIRNEASYGIQFHPEVYHTTDGKKILKNFVLNICGCRQDWTPASFVETTVANLKKKLGRDKVILGLSGGVDSSVAAILLNRAIGDKLTCVFVDNGMLRKNEFNQVLGLYKNMGLNVLGIDASDRFIGKLSGKDVKWLAQGTIYPDVIESISVNGPSATIKSHHNVGGLPETMNLKVVEPLMLLFKDEVRRVGKALNISQVILKRHPFPGPGLAIRILGDITLEKIKMLQEADDIYIQALKKENLYDEVWQSAVILLPVQSVGVMGDERTYENTVVLRAVTSTDGMTADWAHLPYDFLSRVSNTIINKIKGINRVVYDVSSKPPATIEWE